MEKGHSEEFFGEYRDFWWNADFLKLMAKRWKLEQCESVLDVGCGVGHWSEQLFRVLPSHTQITGLELDPKWVDAAPARFAKNRFADRFRIMQGAAESIPFPDNTFDMVTCQTVLIHVRDIPAVLKEMKRVLKPGGLLAVVEPNNISLSLTFGSQSQYESVDEILENVRFHLICERGKKALGRGDSSAGDLVQGLVALEGYEQIQVYLSDKALPMFPPYSTPEQLALKRQAHEWQETDVVHEERDLSLASYLAGGGSKVDFDRHWAEGRSSFAKTKQAMDEGQYHSAGGALMYLVSGRKAFSNNAI